MKVWIVNASDLESYGFIVQCICSTRRKALFKAKKILKEKYGKTDEEINKSISKLKDGYACFEFDNEIVDLWEVEVDE